MAASVFALRPSAAGVWVHCHGSVALAALYPQDDSPAAREGTAAHWAATEPLQGRRVNAGDVAPNGVIVTDEMIECAELYVDTVRALIGEEMHVEETLPAPTIHPENGGTADTWGFAPPSPVPLLHVIDYKFGHGYVDAFENWQGINYTAAILDALGPHSTAERDGRVRITIVQPRNYHRDGPVRSWEVPISELRAYINTLAAAAHAARPLTPGGPLPGLKTGTHCRNCEARHACPALQASAMYVADYVGKAVPFDLTPMQTGGELRQLQHAAKLLDARISGLEDEALAKIRRGEPVPYFAAKQSEGRERFIPSKVPEVLMLGAMLGLPLAKPAEAITPLQARKLGIDEAVITPYCERPKGEIKLIPQDTTDTRRIFGAPKP